ncbi:Phosphatase 2C family protein isoform 1 [Hibiscus syriacus]|uniref:Phosphatase 2C family protein isoform 1 n=1 Tax=Hibiscus syriacus TaxID=106335 RepID=A0A6A2WK70_HIBSY|nr:BRI1 kinase inhibitor 1-like [Hibiscus syriacus]KAE8659101.1 Phosphatase 2C family protein isoform 1 [Hibiscus syriacus]
MNGYQQQKTREEVAEIKQEEGSADKQCPASPPSASSSPSHEFSFTVVSLHSSSNAVPGKTKTPPSMAIDLSPADDIFFHGHLLPLHLLSQLPVSPRFSTNSLDGCNVPVRELLDDPKPDKLSSTNCRSKSDSNIRSSNKNHGNGKVGNFNQSHDVEAKGRPKSKSFSLPRLTRWHHHKGRGVRETEEKEKHKTKMRFDLRHVLKRYVRLVRPLLFFRGRRENRHLHRQSHSFSGNLSSRNKDKELRARRGDYCSAPASMRTSPTNSGLLVATTGYSSSSSGSTMEELQAAIQAAIAHCKNSIKGEDKFNC